MRINEFIHNNASTVFTYTTDTSLFWVGVELSPPGRRVVRSEILTVDRDLDLALIGRSHAVVGDAFVVLGLLPLDLGDV